MVDKNWTREQAWQVEQQTIGTDPEAEPSPHGPFWQWWALNRLDVLFERWRDNNGFALMEAVELCGRHGLVMPEWIADGFSEGFYKVVSLQAVTWDDAFGRPHPPEKQYKSQAADFRARWGVYAYIGMLRADASDKGVQPPALDDGFYEEVGTRFRMKKTKVKRLYKEAKEAARIPTSPPDIPFDYDLSDIWGPILVPRNS